jgi:hypothetical protein
MDTTSLHLVATSVHRGNKLVVRTTDPEIAGFRHAGCSIARIEKDEDLFVFGANVPIKMESDGAATMAFSTDELLESHLYKLTHITLMATDAADPSDPGSQRLPINALFEIIAVGQTPRISEQLTAEHQAIVDARQTDFLAGVGDKSAGSIEFQGLLFVKNCLLRTTMRVGPCELIPFEGLGCHAEIVHIDAFLKKNGHEGVTNIEDAVRRAQRGQPCFVAHFPRVLASSVDQAGEIMKQEGALLCDVLALHRMSYGTIFGGVLINRATGESSFWIDAPTYTGNLAGGFLAGEVGSSIRDDLEKARSSPRLALYLTLLREAQREERTEFAYFRFWNLLETIARAPSKAFVGKPLLDWAGTQRVSSKGTPLNIEDKAEQLVFELLRSSMPGISARGIGGHVKQGSFDELVPIWYRHRNCVGHRGGCFADDASFCSRVDPKFVNCKAAHDEIVAAHRARSRQNDEYLRLLSARRGGSTGRAGLRRGGRTQVRSTARSRAIFR